MTVDCFHLNNDSGFIKCFEFVGLERDTDKGSEGLEEAERWK